MVWWGTFLALPPAAFKQYPQSYQPLIATGVPEEAIGVFVLILGLFQVIVAYKGFRSLCILSSCIGCLFWTMVALLYGFAGSHLMSVGSYGIIAITEYRAFQSLLWSPEWQKATGVGSGPSRSF